MGGGHRRPEEVAGGEHDPEVVHRVRRRGVGATEVDTHADQSRAEQGGCLEEPQRQPVEEDQEPRGRQVRGQRRHHEPDRVPVGRMRKRQRDEQQGRPDPEQVGEGPGHRGGVLEHPDGLGALAQGDAIGQDAAGARGAMLERGAIHRPHGKRGLIIAISTSTHPDMSRSLPRRRAPREPTAAEHRRLMRAPLGPIALNRRQITGEDPMSEPTIVEFDLDRYLRNSKKVDLGGIEWGQIPDHPLSHGDVMCLHYMMDIETHTVIYLRDLLATRVAADPQITAFLSCWVYEELWHGEAFSDFLRCYGIEVPSEPKLPDGSTPMPTRPTRWRALRVRVGVGNGLGIVPTMLGSMVARDFAAIHMMWGAVNELTTLTGYYALIRRSDHPELHRLLHKVIRDERRHFAFYRAQAKARMERSRAARKL